MATKKKVTGEEIKAKIEAGKKKKTQTSTKSETNTEVKTKTQSEAETQVETPVKEKKKTKLQQTIEDYYNEALEEKKYFEPKYAKVTQCTVCGSSVYERDSYRTYSLGYMCTMNDIGERHITICSKCCKKLYYKFLEQTNGDVYLAMAHLCQVADIYYNNDIVDEAIEFMNNTSQKGIYDMVSSYMLKLNVKHIVGATFWDSPMLANNLKEYLITDPEYAEKLMNEVKPQKEYPLELSGWDQESLDNYDQVLEWYKYDPFKDEPIDDRKKLYYNLIGFSDPEIADDVGKANACIDMCRSLQRIEKLNKRRIKLEDDEDFDVKEVAALASLQKQERESVQKYQKEWGFNARYSLNKQQGSGSLTGILKEMDDNLFEDSLPNAYDIKTSEAMVMAAEASWKGIFSQLNLSESEFSEIVKNQREEITKLRRSLDDTKEKLRLANIEIKKAELQAKLDKQGEVADLPKL